MRNFSGVAREEKLDLGYQSLDEVIKKLTEARERLKQHGDLMFEVDTYNVYDSAEADIKITYRSPETEQEKKDREEQAKRFAASRRRTYEDLKKEFEK